MVELSGLSWDSSLPCCWDGAFRPPEETSTPEKRTPAAGLGHEYRTRPIPTVLLFARLRLVDLWLHFLCCYMLPVSSKCFGAMLTTNLRKSWTRGNISDGYLASAVETACKRKYYSNDPAIHNNFICWLSVSFLSSPLLSSLLFLSPLLSSSLLPLLSPLTLRLKV